MKLFIARDKNNELYLHGSKPTRENTEWAPTAELCLLPLSEDLFRDITWYDEPVECEIVAKGTSQKQWVDMKDATPPKESDKKKHLLLFKDGTVCIGRWSAANQLFRNEDIWELHKTNVTHWMAIPDVPELF